MDENIQNNEQLASLFHRAARLLMRRGHQHGPMHHSQGRILSILSDRKTMSQRELLDIFQVRSASLSELLGKLEQYGYIARSRDEQDKRSIILTITEQGEALVREHLHKGAEQGKSLFDPLSMEDRQDLERILRKILVTWEQEAGAVPGHCRGCPGRKGGFSGNRGHGPGPMRAGGKYDPDL